MLTEREETIEMIHNVYKDAYGVRPRHMNLAAMSQAELNGVMDSMQGHTICAWPDGDWCYRVAIEEYTWKSDDYQEILLPYSVFEDDVDDYLKTLTL